jgi:hypothetical protein
MIAEIRDNGQLDWSHFLVVEEGNDVTPPLKSQSTPLCPLGNRKACVARSPCPLHVPFQKMWEAQAAFLAETTLAGFTARKVPAPPWRR